MPPVAHYGTGDVTTAATGSGASITISRPPNVARRDLLVCVVFHQLSGGTLTPPAGWLPCGPAGNTVGTFSAFWRAVGAVGNEPDTYTWTNTGGARAVAVMFRVTGANLAAPIDAFGAVSTVGTVAVTAPGLTTTQDNTLLVAAWVASRGAGLDPPVITQPDPMMSVGTVTAAPSSSSTLRVAVTPRGDSGQVSSKTATVQPTASSGTAFMFAIAPEPPATPTVTFPRVRVEVAFTDGASTGTGLTLDDPSRGRLDTGTLGGGATSAPVWTDVAPWLRAATITRGSTRVDAPIVTYEGGQLTVVLDNADGRFDPNNLDGPYTAEITHVPYGRATQCTAMRAVRVMAEWDGTTYELWRGFADQWEPSYEPGSQDSTCVLTATDASKVLAGIDRTALALPVGGGEDSGARVNRILTSAGWPAGDRLVAAGNSTLQETTLEGDAWAELQAVAQSELGELYVDGGGRVVFRNRLAYLTDTRSNTSQALFGDAGAEPPIEDLGTSSDDATFFNEVAVTRAGGVEQVATDPDSQALYYRKTYRPPADPLLETDEAALGYAHWLLHIASEPELRFTELTVNPAAGPSGLWPHALGREIGDRITVRRRPPPDQALVERQSFIRGVRHEFTDESWTTTWVLQDATRYGSFFVLDHPNLGVLDSNALAY